MTVRTAALALWMSLFAAGCDYQVKSTGGGSPGVQPTPIVVTPEPANLEGPVSVSGQLLFDADPEAGHEGGAPAAGARVFLEQNPAVEVAATATGAFTLNIPTGTALTEGSGGGREFTLIGLSESNGKKFMVRRQAQAFQGSRMNLGTLTLRETGAMQGSVRLIDGAEHLGIDVYVPGTSFVAKTDRGGNFSILYVPEGLYEIVAEKSGYRLASLGAFRVVSKKTTTVGDHVLDTFDVTPPDTSLLQQPLTLTSSNTATFTFSSSEMFSSFVCALDGAQEAPCVSPATFVGLADGPHSFSVRAQDRSGNVDASPAQHSWTIDATPPTSTFILANNGSDWTTSALVPLNLGAQGAAEMRVSTLSDFSDANWQPYASTTTLSLPSGDGAKRIYAEFRDGVGNVSPASIAVITLDTRPPENETLLINGGAEQANSVSVTLSLFATDAAAMQVSSDGTFDSEPWIPFAPSLTYLLPAPDCGLARCKNVMARFRDAAGNIGGTASAAITLDTTPPSMPNIISSSQTVDAQSVTISIAAAVTDPFFHHYEIAGGLQSPDQFQSVSTLRTQTAFPVDLSQDRENRIRIRAVDAAGNISEESAVVITEDSTPPEPPTGLRVMTGNGRARVMWTHSVSSDVAGYELTFSHDGSGSTHIPIGHTVADEGESPLDVGFVQGATLTNVGEGALYVMVQAVDRVGHRSALPTATGQHAAFVTPTEIAPTLLAEFHPDTKGLPYATSVKGDILVVAERCHFDPASTMTSGQVHPNQNCTVADGSVRIVSIANPSAPVQLARCSGDVGQSCGLVPGSEITDAPDVVFDGVYAYVANGSRGIAVLDLRNPAAPQALGTCAHNNTCLPSGGFARKLDVQGGMIYVADGPRGFRVIDGRNPAALSTTSIRRCTGTTSAGCSTSALATDADHMLGLHDLTSAEYDLSSTSKRCEAMRIKAHGDLLFGLTGSVDVYNPRCSTRRLEILRMQDDDTVGSPVSAAYPTKLVEARAAWDVTVAQDFYISGDILFLTEVGNAFSAYSLPEFLTSPGTSQILYMQGVVNRRFSPAGPLLAVAASSNGTEDALQLFDLASLAQLQSSYANNDGAGVSLPLVARWGKSGALSGADGYWPNDVKSQGSLLFMASGGETQKATVAILDTQSPVTPRHLPQSHVHVNMGNLDLSVKTHERFVITNGYGYTNKVSLLDASNISSPTLWSAASSGEYLLNPRRAFDLSWPYLFTGTCSRRGLIQTSDTTDKINSYMFSAAEGAPISFEDTGAGLVANTTYYMRDAVTLPDGHVEFKVAATRGGPAIDLTAVTNLWTHFQKELRVLDMSTRIPTVVGTLALRSNGTDCNMNDPYEVSALKVHGPLLMMGQSEQGAFWVNISNPANPYYLGVDGGGLAEPLPSSQPACRVLDIVSTPGSAYLSKRCGVNSVVEAVPLPSTLVNSQVQSLAVASAFSPAPAEAMTLYPWGGRLFVSLLSQDGAAVRGCAACLPSDLGAPINLNQSAGETDLPSVGMGGSMGRFLYSITPGRLDVVDIAGTWSSGMPVVGTYTAAPSAFTPSDSAALGPYTVVAGQFGLWFFDFEYD